MAFLLAPQVEAELDDITSLEKAAIHKSPTGSLTPSLRDFSCLLVHPSWGVLATKTYDPD